MVSWFLVPWSATGPGKRRQAPSVINWQSPEERSTCEQASSSPHRHGLLRASMLYRALLFFPRSPCQLTCPGKNVARVLTYNMFLRPPLVKSNPSDFKELRLSLFCDQVLPHFDIIALQEVFELGSSRQARLISAAKRHGYNYTLKSYPPSLCALLL